MKTTLYLFAVSFFLITSACNKDEDDRNQFIAEYDAEESTVVSQQTITYDNTFSIIADSSSDARIIINGFGSIVKTNIPATVNGNSFTAEEHEILVNGLDGTMTANGELNGNTLTYTYTLVSEALPQGRKCGQVPLRNNNFIMILN